MTRQLATYVHVHQDDGTVRVYGPHDAVPDDDAARITNPKAWAEGSKPDQAAPTGSAVPPKGGAGSGKDAWAEYAAANGVQHDGDATRDDIIAACDSAGVPTE